LKYEVALFRESSPGSAGQIDTAVEQAVPIGTRLQLRASIGRSSAWKHVKLTEVTISADPDDARANGHIKLIDEG